MRKTVITFDDDIYEQIEKISVKKYGNTEHISEVVNEILRNSLNKEGSRKKKVKMSISTKINNANKLTPEEIDRIAEEEFSSS
ncbi:MAG: hypothetical protein QXD91_05145 [Saccharolobus sp.]